MDVLRSELQQELFAVVGTNIAIVMPVSEECEAVDELDIELDIFFNNQNDHLVRISYSITAKRTHRDRIGIDIGLQATCDFSIDRKIEVSSNLFNTFIHYSATAITYNNIRTYLQNITSYYPVEPYILPAIDLNDLCRKYAEKMEREVKTEPTE